MTKSRTLAELLKHVPIPSKLNRKANGTRLENAKQNTMLALLGNPRADLSDRCQPVARPDLKAMMTTAPVGPFRVTGLRPAVESLAAVMADIKRAEPEVYASLGSAGMLCVRHVRGVPHAISNHAWGTAIDLTVGGSLDPWNDGLVQVALTLIAPVFNEHGWFWGAEFSREDGMHFECSDGLIREWAKQGRLGHSMLPLPDAPNAMLGIGDRGEQVRALQRSLNDFLGAGLLPDGIFGRETQAAVMHYQLSRQLEPDGTVGRAAWEALETDRRTALGAPAPAPARRAPARAR